ncbi:unnamed protein product [Anisakis simplex]|uniref:C15 (inferred by orthology to a D. melanogaster protein) n=1 Tax=Anisakis simplex TaxID=6269 RepID=A0A0M3JT56_ANISI|nr:unnamed protein product [Anisakis simplex]
MVASNYYDNVKNNDNTHQTHSYESDEEEDSDDTNVTISNTARKHSSPAIVSLPSTTSNIRRVGHPYQSRAPAKHKKPRTSFSKKQVALLEDRFLSQKYLASTERASLAIELDMSDAQVKTWFQNRRTKWRRQEAEEKEFEDKANARMLSSYRQCFFARPDITL